METKQRQVAVIGGGISGLTTAWLLRKAGVDVRLFDAASSVGGCMRTDHRAGFLLEKGPFNVMVRDPAFEALMDDVAGEVEVVPADRAAKRRYIYRRGAIHVLPSNPIALATTKLLSPRGRVRLMTGLVASRRGGPFEETLEQVAVRRFGPEVADTFISAAVSGIYAGDIGKLTLKACFPGVARVDREARSIIGFGLAKALGSIGHRKNRKRRRWRGLVSLDGGLGALSDALGRRLGSDLLTGCQVRQIKRNGTGHDVTFQDEAGTTQTQSFRQVVIALSASGAGQLLAPALPEAGDQLGSIESASMVVINLGFHREDVGHPLDGFGFLVPRNEPDFPLMGMLWADSVFPHHAPRDRRLLRVFIGGARDRSAVGRSADELVDTAIGAVRDLLQIRGEPCLVDICRHKSAIPQYHQGHTEKIARIRSAVDSVPGLHLVGNYLEGVSLNDCVRLGARVAGEVAQEVNGLQDSDTTVNNMEEVNAS